MTNDINAGPVPAQEPEATRGVERYRHLSLEEQVAALLTDLEGAQTKASQNLDLAQRAQAELVNYRRRADEERISIGKYSNTRIISNLLRVREELDLAINHAGEAGPTASWIEGVKLIQRNLANLLESEGVTAVSGVGAMFNPLEHQALGTEETADHQPGLVTRVLRAGYRLHDRVIQPAQVVVACEPRIPDPATDTPNHEGESK